MKMFITSDVTVYGNKEYPAVSNVFKDVDLDLKLVVGMDAYLRVTATLLPNLNLFFKYIH